MYYILYSVNLTDLLWLIAYRKKKSIFYPVKISYLTKFIFKQIFYIYDLRNYWPPYVVLMFINLNLISFL